LRKKCWQRVLIIQFSCNQWNNSTCTYKGLIMFVLRECCLRFFEILVSSPYYKNVFTMFSLVPNDVPHVFLKLLITSHLSHIFYPRFYHSSQTYKLHGFLPNLLKYVISYCLKPNVMHYLNTKVVCMTFVCKKHK